jgi:hypothetical protein
VINDPEEMKKIVDEALARGKPLPKKKRQRRLPRSLRRPSDGNQSSPSSDDESSIVDSA